MRRARGLIVAVALVLGACSGDSPGHTNEGEGAESLEVTVFAAASLKPALSDVRPGVKVNFAGSQQLAAQIEAGAYADVIVTADEHTMARLVDKGLVEPPTIAATTTLAIVVRQGNPKGVRSLADLPRADLTVVLADPSVPAGRYAKRAFELAGITARPKSLELDVESAGMKVSLGEADAAVVYRTFRAKDTELVAIPLEHNVVARYPVAVLEASKRKDDARAFAFALPAVLERAGFDKP